MSWIPYSSSSYKRRVSPRTFPYLSHMNLQTNICTTTIISEIRFQLYFIIVYFSSFSGPTSVSRLTLAPWVCAWQKMAEAESATEATLRAQSEKTAKFMEVRLIDWFTNWFLRKAVTIVTESKQFNFFCILHVRGGHLKLWDGQFCRKRCPGGQCT